MDPNVPSVPPVKPKSQRSEPWNREGINLKMTAKGYYYWEISVYGDVGPEMVKRLEELDDYLKKTFPKNTTQIPE